MSAPWCQFCGNSTNICQVSEYTKFMNCSSKFYWTPFIFLNISKLFWIFFISDWLYDCISRIVYEHKSDDQVFYVLSVESVLGKLPVVLILCSLCGVCSWKAASGSHWRHGYNSVCNAPKCRGLCRHCIWHQGGPINTVTWALSWSRKRYKK